MERNFKFVFRKEKDGDPVRIFYEKDGVLPWSVQYRGAGHYFKTAAELLKYCDERGFGVWVEDIMNPITG